MCVVSVCVVWTKWCVCVFTVLVMCAHIGSVALCVCVCVVCVWVCARCVCVCGVRRVCVHSI